jgi:uncharacterized protein YbbK (DUF523 family)
MTAARSELHTPDVRDTLAPMRVGVSACLLGDTVRYDGGHKHSTVVDALGDGLEWVKVCPEVECGMGTPREPIQLVKRDGRLRLRTVTTGADHTDRMRAFAARRLDELAALDLCGYILKSRSPSCGPAGVDVHDADGATRGTGAGMFARALLDRFPGLPIEDEERLADTDIRARFIERVAAYRHARRRGAESP